MTARPVFYGPLLYFRTVPALDQLNPTQLEAIAQNTEEELFSKGSYLIRPGEPADAFFIVVDGDVFVRGGGGREYRVGPGGTIGFLDLLARSAHDLEARAEGDTLALKLDWDVQLEIYERNPPILVQYLRYLATRLLEILEIEGGERRPLGERDRGAPSPGIGALDEPWEGELGSSGKRSDAVPPGEIEGVPDGQRPGHSHSLDLVERIRALHRCPSLPQRSMDALAELARHVREVSGSAGTRLWSVGDPSSDFLLVHSGRLARYGPRGLLGATAGPGDMAGELEALAGLPRRWDLRTETTCVGLRIPVEPFLDVMEDHFDMGLEYASILARRLMASS